MSPPTVHVVGAGMAGLAAAVAVARTGTHVKLYEAAPWAGGRCRSFYDPLLERTIDTGSHLLLGANRDALAYAQGIGAELIRFGPKLNFADIKNGRRWTLTPTRLPAALSETLCALGLPWVAGSQSVADRLGRSRRFGDLWHPLCLAALNTPPQRASARVFARALRAVLLGGPQAFHGHIFPHGLSAALVDPALALLRRLGADIRFGQRLTSCSRTRLTFGPVLEDINRDDRVILALPPWALSRIVPGIGDFPFEPILNLHYRLPLPVRLDAPLGMIGGQGQWLFVRDDVASVTISAAANADPAQIWAEIAPLLAQPAILPAYRQIRERRATLRHDPQTIARRPGPTTTHPGGVFLAGDWLRSPWPCTIESAVSSGLRAACLAMGRDDLRFS